MPSFDTLMFRPADLPPLSRLLVAAAACVVTWEARHRTRKALARLDAHLLRDAGLDVMTARAEANRRFWQA